MVDHPSRCIECGGLTSSLNEDEDGLPCPACAERLLETLPGVFHSPWVEPEEEFAMEESDAEEEASFDISEPGDPPKGA